MGQKTIPQSLRLDNLKNWNSNWITEKKDYSKLFYLDHSLRQYLQKFCQKNELNINNLNIEKHGKYLNIYINIYNFKENKINSLKNFENDLEKSINKYLNYLNLNYISKVYLINVTMGNLKIGYTFYKQFRKFPSMAMHFYSFINVSYIAFYTQSVEMISNYLVKNLQKLPKHRQYLNNIDKILNKQYQIFDNCLGYKIELKGRVNGLARSRKIFIKSGKTPLNTLKYNVKYDVKEILTPYGICSLKVWLFFKK